MKPLVLMHLASIQVRWPNGKTEFYDAPAAVDRIIELEDGKDITRQQSVNYHLRLLLSLEATVDNDSKQSVSA